jgi:hypothetical protein
MKRPVRKENGKYVISGKSYNELFGSRAQVHNGTAYKTTGGLTKSNLVMNKWGRIVSANKHKTAKKEKRLQKYGYYTKKGKFGAVKRNSSMKRKSQKVGGGVADNAQELNVPVPEVNNSVDKVEMNPSQLPVPKGVDVGK